jgi:hypothetical protein
MGGSLGTAPDCRAEKRASPAFGILRSGESRARRAAAGNRTAGSRRGRELRPSGQRPLRAERQRDAAQVLNAVLLSQYGGTDPFALSSVHADDSLPRRSDAMTPAKMRAQRVRSL